MRIVDRATFMRMPPATLYRATSEPVVIGDIAIKGGSIGGIDFLTAPLGGTVYEHWDCDELADRYDEMTKQGASYRFEEVYQRDAMFEEKERYLVYKAADLRQINAIIERAIRVAEKGGAV